MIITLLNALIAVPKLASLVESLCAQITAWYVARQTNETLSLIADAAALSANSKTDQDRLNASKAWQIALSRDRVS